MDDVMTAFELGWLMLLILTLALTPVLMLTGQL
jgi:hypothetical protein